LSTPVVCAGFSGAHGRHRMQGRGDQIVPARFNSVHGLCSFVALLLPFVAQRHERGARAFFVMRQARQLLYEKRNLCYAFLSRGILFALWGGARSKYEDRKNWI
jgi:hypothetical protein